MDMAEVRERLQTADFARIFATDLNGRPMTLQVNPENINAIVERGIGFDGSSVAGMASVDDSDRLLVPIPESLRIVEFKDGRLAFFIGRIDDSPAVRSHVDARRVLEDVLERARADLGCTFLAGPEHEFFLLKSDRFAAGIHSDRAGYFHADPRDKGDAVRRNIIDVLRKCGVRLEKAHHEVTASQHEINLVCADALEAADRTVLFNYVTQKVAAEHGYHATFMPKPFDGQNRNAFHIHLSMRDLEGRNLFHDEGAEHHLSKTARQFIAGILKYARQTCIIMASTYNSYKAYVADREAPIVRGWGLRNRSSMVRVPHNDRPENMRIELRTPDPAGNVYLQIALLIGMGVRGIAEDLDCGQPDVGSTYRKRNHRALWDKRFLPACMFEALVEAERSKFLKEFLGATLYRQFLALKRAEWENFRIHVTAREHRMYLSA